MNKHTNLSQNILKHKNLIHDKWLYFPIIVLIISFLIKLLENAQLIWIFPLDLNHDLPSYMSLLYLTIKYGYVSSVPCWYNGLISLKTYPPLWFFITIPIYYLFKNIQLATYISFIIIYSIGFFFINLLGKIYRFSFTKKISFFLFYYANPLFLSYYLRLGRPAELLGWTIFIAFFIILDYYKDHKLNFKFYLFFICIYSLLILAYFTPTIVSSIFLVSFLIIKKRLKDKIIVIFSVISSLLITSLWWLPFLKEIKSLSGGTYTPLNWLNLPTKLGPNVNLFMDKFLTILCPIAFIIIFIFYFISINKFNIKKSKKELLFYLPALILAILLITRILVYIPLFNRMYPDSYNSLYIFLFLVLFFKTKIRVYPKQLKKIVIYALIIIPILFLLASIFYITPYKKHTIQDKEIISLLPEVNDRLLILAENERLLYAYATIYHNITTPSGASSVLGGSNLILKLNSIYKDIKNEKCKSLKNKFSELNVREIISTIKYCNALKKCGLKTKIQKEHSCLLLNN